ncbi:MAG TPA: ATP-grasp domain-containing protein [Steroidobacteraceae bacterium]|nr:ATP-grasp domain-containing protein [Steroidobacteraceae bacterium]
MSTPQAAPRGPVALIIATTPWPLSSRLAVRMIAHGCEVAALCPRGHVLGQVSGMRALYLYRSRDSVAALERALAASAPDIVIPCDDRAVWQLHDLHARRPDLRRLIETSLGSPAAFPILRSRSRLIELARDCGIRVPETQVLESAGDIAAWFRDHRGSAVVKVDGTWGGSGVQVVQSQEQAGLAFQRFNEPERPGSSWKRWLINRDPLAFWTGPARHVSIQRFVPGRPANCMIAAWEGRLLGLVGVEVLCTQGKTGASTIVRLIRSAEMVRDAQRLAESLGLSGFYGLDYIVEEETGMPFLIEVNARCTQLGHLVLPGQGDLAGLLCAQLGARAQSAGQPEAAIDRDVIAFFPQALAWNPDSPYMQQCHHDIPWTQPALVRELLRDPWAERRWVSRLYHWLRGKERSPVPNVVNFLRLAAQNGFASSPVRELPDKG